ncbi:hypothetical protein SEA_NEDARYA_80 [Gordonia phage Nedarya]|nr:hypothetical protein SEA_NEDARYA_80 [Gordonia phage Nedarya]
MDDNARIEKACDDLLALLREVVPYSANHRALDSAREAVGDLRHVSRQKCVPTKDQERIRYRAAVTRY